MQSHDGRRKLETWLSPEVHTWLRRSAEKQGETLSAVARRLLTAQYVFAGRKPRGRRTKGRAR